MFQKGLLRSKDVLTTWRLGILPIANRPSKQNTHPDHLLLVEAISYSPCISYNQVSREDNWEGTLVDQTGTISLNLLSVPTSMVSCGALVDPKIQIVQFGVDFEQTVGPGQYNVEGLCDRIKCPIRSLAIFFSGSTSTMFLFEQNCLQGQIWRFLPIKQHLQQ